MSELNLLLESLRAALRPKRLIVAGLLIVLPAIIALMWRMASGAERFEAPETYNTLALEIVFRFILTLLAVLYGTGALSQEIEGRTIVYLLTRPIPRWRILLAKLVSAWILVTVATCLSTILLAFATFGGKPDMAMLLGDLKVIPAGAAAYSALFCLLSTFLARPLLYALLYGVGWENIASLFPGGFSRLSILTYLRTLSPHLKDSAQDVSGGGASGALFASDPSVITRPQCWLGLGIAIVMGLGLAILIFSRREYAPREEAG